MKRRRCRLCGVDVAEDANFCSNCGGKLRRLCNCYIKKKPYNCGQDQCPGYRLFLIEMLRERVAQRNRKENDYD